MGYESRIIIVNRGEVDCPNGGEYVYAQEVARFDLCCMGYERVNGKTFSDIFCNEIDFDLLSVGGEESTRVDCYGDVCCWADLVDVLGWLQNSQVVKEYRRAKLFYLFCQDLLQCQDDYEQLRIVHYGY